MLDWIFDLDRRLLLYINKDLSNPLFDSFFPWMTDRHRNFGFSFVFLPLLIITFIYFKKKKGVLLTGMLIFTIALDDFMGGKIIKPFFARPRPSYSGVEIIQRAPEFGGYSFISNHSANMFCLATFINVFYPRTSIIFYILAFLTAFSRVYVGVHYPLDVFGGAIVGIIIGLVGAHLAKRILQWRRLS